MMDILFGELSNEEKARLFIAWCNGRAIQFKEHHSHVWSYVTTSPTWHPDYYYRAKPEKPINTIDWSLIHPDYNHLAKDENKEWWLYRDSPRPELSGWGGDTSSRRFPLDILTFFNPKEVDWRESLISRPNIT